MRCRTLLSAATAPGISHAAAAGLAGAMGLVIRRVSACAVYPSRALTLIVPFSPGSSVGINARLLQPYRERTLGQSIALSFIQGAGGLAGYLLGAEAAWTATR